ncbi:DNA cytosine methyltransferase [Pseudomonas aeruginosa]|uniref:DNA cytosine methyltransferase n=1 Tax=Pseudomonas aeruginosa TaxID=287 RepID=UPI00066D2151|nr:DNA cytosine methyltransferase [Pseudomonas aeruginosa]MCO7655558.1 DNA cytosine methyltransferase [Pseudomonas aeruginosa]HCU2063709.1 DNA cytosine methyltransferase [Pseudomonas aeruginosa]HEJ4932906.1 DNA cytosine methyltransferase [Pseudomonas aeruginosa]
MNHHQELDFCTMCSGIEAPSVALEPIGFRARWFAEIEPFPSAVLAHHYPSVPNHGDMTKLIRRILTGAIEAPPLAIAGTPCQAFSVAGWREGLTDPRGALTIKFVETIDAIDLVRTHRSEPECIAWWENVPGVLSDKENAFGCFLGALVGESEEIQPPGGKWKDAGCVYGPKRTAAWRILDAQYFGLAQRRRRVFVIASARAGFDPCEVLFEREGMRRDHPPRRGESERVANTVAGGARKRGGYSHDDNPLTAFGGNNTAGPVDVATARNACNSASGRLDFESETFVVHGTQDPDVALGIAHTLGRNHGQENAVFDPNQITSVTNRSQPTPVAVPPIAFSCKDYGADAGEVAVQNTTGVRRLTPRECERLQGFPDDYTLIPWRGKPATECPDGPRYKAIGNSKAVPVVRWIGRRLKAHLEKLS